VTPNERTEALARGYALLGRLLVQGASADELATLAAIPGLGDALDPTTDPDEVATQYVTAFDLGVPPYGSAFVDPSGHVGGPVTRAVGDDIAAAGLQPWTDEVAADHLGVLLGHLAAVVAVSESDARRFATQHVMSWLPAFVVALDSIDAPFWRDVVRFALELVAIQVADDRPSSPLGLPVSPDWLTAPDCDLRTIASYLSSPTRCGAFLTDADLLRIGRALDLPRGFGPRRTRIETLLRSAAEYDLVPRACEHLAATFERYQHRFEELGVEYTDAWSHEVRATRQVLHRIAAEARQPGMLATP
jgi:TorA maturation chaperone TorD